ncbi:MAG: hypothetical protein AAB368_02800, partial [bacterium]
MVGGPAVAGVEVYDPADDAWTPRSDLPTPRTQMGGGVLDGRVYAVGGGPGPLDSVEYGTLGLAPGGALTFTLTGQAGTVCAATDVSNTAWVSGGFACQTSVQQTGAVGFTIAPAGVGPIILSQIRTPAAPSGEEPVQYRILVTNAGSATLAGIEITDTLSSAYTFMSQSATGGLVWNGFTAGVLAWSRSDIGLVPGETATVWLDVVPCTWSAGSSI